MNLKRFGIALVIVAVGVGLLAWQVHNERASRAAAQDRDADRQEAADAPVDTQPSATQPGETASAGEPPAEARSDTQPSAAPATAPADGVDGPADTPAPATAEAPATEPSAPPAAEAPEREPGGRPQLFVADAGRDQTVTIGSLDPRSDFVVQVEIVNRGAAAKTIKLSRHFATVADKQLWEDNPDEYERVRREKPDEYKGHYSLLNPVGVETEHYPLATRKIVVYDADGRRIGAAALDRFRWSPADVPEGGVGEDAQAASFEQDLYYGATPADAAKLLTVRKTYLVRKKDYSVTMALELINATDEPLIVGIDQSGPTGVPREDIRGDMRRCGWAWVEESGEAVGVQLKGVSEVADGNPGSRVTLGRSTDPTPMLWVGQTNKYFGSMMYLEPDVEDQLAWPGAEAAFYGESVPETTSSITCLTGVRIGLQREQQGTGSVDVPQLSLEGGATRTVSFDLFAGPKKREMFVKPGAPYYRPLYEKLNYIATIDFGACCCSWAPLSLGMMWLLQTLSVVAFGNYGVAIILLVVLVRLVLHPLTKRSQVSMSRMKKLAPQMQKLKEKYADDKEALNREMMKLYKQQGATPLLGCLPMLIQMPIWIALWTSINATVELRHAAFLPVWITNLAGPDALFSWSEPISIPLLGALTSFNLLPILLGIAMFFQTKMNPQMAGAAQTDQQASQQKMMAYMMPAIMLLIFYNAPAGLTLYIMTSVSAGVAEQYFIRKHIEEKEAVEAAAETTVVAPGKKARSARPKKPKGPFWNRHG